jgi:hypothetical protein
MTPASQTSAAALRSAAPVSDARYTASERGLDCKSIRGEWSEPIDTIGQCKEADPGQKYKRDDFCSVAQIGQCSIRAGANGWLS